MSRTARRHGEIMEKFKLVSSYVPGGDQPDAIRELTEGISRGIDHQVLLGVTGSGKTFTIANVIEKLNRPTLVVSHNKTLAAQLYGEFKTFFPDNAVEYFISYYDYYQPEAYVPSTDTYIGKEADINEDIDRLRLRATSSVIERRDVIVVASVSCIYGLGSPEEYKKQLLLLEEGERIDRDTILERLVDMQYTRNDYDFSRGTFRVRGDVVEIMPAYASIGVRIELFDDSVERLSRFDPVDGRVISRGPRLALYPAKHFIVERPMLEKALDSISKELEVRLSELNAENKLLEAQRLASRTRYDLEMLSEIGYCSGIENYSRHFSDRRPGDRPSCLLDYFPDDKLVILDESHVTLPQIRGMYRGDRSRKETLIEHGFRLPSALDNRPLIYEEFLDLTGQVISISATPGDVELEYAGGVVVEQLIRPTGLLDPEVEVRPSEGQIDDLMEEIRLRTLKNQRTLVTTLTKRMAEDLSEYLTDAGIRVRYLHSDIQALDRIELLRDLRLGAFDVLVGINLLREGLDLPEVSLVAVLDADKEGFLRSDRSLIQTAGRAARNADGLVLLYADGVTGSMERALSEMLRRRRIQNEYNLAHDITPTTVYKSVDDIMLTTAVADDKKSRLLAETLPGYHPGMDEKELIIKMETEMNKAAEKLDFERAALLRDELFKMKGLEWNEGNNRSAGGGTKQKRRKS